MTKRIWMAGAFLLICLGAAPQASAQQAVTFYPFVIARGSDRAAIESTPIEQRPNRPLHFYGNTVRRRYYREQGNPIREQVPRRERIQAIRRR